MQRLDTHIFLLMKGVLIWLCVLLEDRHGIVCFSGAVIYWPSVCMLSSAAFGKDTRSYISQESQSYRWNCCFAISLRFSGLGSLNSIYQDEGSGLVSLLRYNSMHRLTDSTSWVGEAREVTQGWGHIQYCILIISRGFFKLFNLCFKLWQVDVIYKLSHS